ncbi:hypothetical protein H8959_005306 [Pygathrix nigripes]
MARQPEEEETAGARALRPPLWLLCLVACWLLGAGAEADFSILDEAQVLASQMRRLAVEELGVVTMQSSQPRLARTIFRTPHPTPLTASSRPPDRGAPMGAGWEGAAAYAAAPGTPRSRRRAALQVGSALLSPPGSMGGGAGLVDSR